MVKASDGPGALATFDAEAPDLVILDINMPGASGFEVCTAIRARGDVPVMMLTARGEEQDLVKALELGADDYLTKPFSPKTLLARVKALLRRASADRAHAPLSAGRVTLDLEGYTVRIGERRADQPDQARAAAAADAAGAGRPRGEFRSPAGAGVGASRLGRPAAAQAAGAPAAPQDRSQSGRAAVAADRRSVRATSWWWTSDRH